MINEREGVSIDQQRITFQGKILKNDSNLFEAGLLEGSTVDSFIPLLGGGVISNTNMEPAFVALCQKYVYNKKICRECYATNSIKANTCRKRKCGRSGKLRLKKVAKKWLSNLGKYDSKEFAFSWIVTETFILIYLFLMWWKNSVTLI